MKHFVLLLLLLLLLFTWLSLCFEYKNKFIRNLEDDSTSDFWDSDTDYDSTDSDDTDDTDDTDEPSANITEIVPKPQFILKDVGNYEKKDKQITFVAFFIRLYTKIVPKIVYFTIKINKIIRLRNLEDEEIQVPCILDENEYQKNDNLIYKCSFDTKIENFTSISINQESIILKNEDNNLTDFDVDIPISSKAKQSINNIQNKTENITIEDYIILENSTLEQNEMKFTVSGTIQKNDNLKDGDATLLLYEKENETLKDIPCELIKKWGNQYDLECTPKIDISGELDGTEIDTNNKTLIISTYNKDEFLNFNVYRNKFYKKTSNKGLSGGAIAALIISCVAALVFLGVLIIFFRNPKNIAPPIEKSSIGHYESNEKITNNN